MYRLRIRKGVLIGCSIWKRLIEGSSQRSMKILVNQKLILDAHEGNTRNGKEKASREREFTDGRAWKRIPFVTGG